LITSLIREAERRSGVPLLRVHWYDAARNGVPDAQQERIGELSKVKLRLGRFGVDGQQKGVDLRIGLDLVAHARNGASDIFYLVSGDDDLTEAVEEAQVHGAQVVVLAVPGADAEPHAVSRHLVRAADELDVLPVDVIDEAVMRIEVPPPAVPPAEREDRPAADAPDASVVIRAAAPSPKDLATRARPVPPVPASIIAYQGSTGGPSRILPGYEDPEEYDEDIEGVVDKVLTAYRQSASPEDLAALTRGKPSIPRDIDRALLVDMSNALDVDDLSEPIRFRLRAVFWDRLT
jgi:uncharacterized LabA/DUF88 family protein